MEIIVSFFTYQNQTNNIALFKLVVAFVQNSEYFIHFRGIPSAPQHRRYIQNQWVETSYRVGTFNNSNNTAALL